MYFHLFGAVKALFNFDTKERTAEREKIRTEDHSYVRLGPGLRAPCPGLNALANQGYLYGFFFFFFGYIELLGES